VAVGGTTIQTLVGDQWRSGPNGADLVSVAFGNGRFVAVGSGGKIQTSQDGLTWTNRTSGTAATLRRVVLANNNFLAVGDSETVLRSTDGIQWSTVSLLGAPSLTGGKLLNGAFSFMVSLGSLTSAQVQASRDLRTWTTITNLSVNATITDTGAKDLPARFYRLTPLEGGAQATLTLTNNANQYSGDPLRIVAYLNNTVTPIVVGSRSGNWNPQQTWTMSLSVLTPGLEYTFELQDPAYGNAVIPPRSNPLVIQSGAALTGYIYNTGSGGYFGWYTKWGWAP